jgi:hypothetical protein
MHRKLFRLHHSSFRILHSAFCILHSAFCIIAALAAFAADAATPVDAGVKAVDDLPALPAEPIMRWYGRDKRKVYPVPVDDPHPVFARVTFGKNHPKKGTLIFTVEAIGTYFQPKYSFVLDAECCSPLIGFPRNAESGGVPIDPGSSSLWVELTDILDYGYNCIFSAKAGNEQGREFGADAMPDFRIEFSRDCKKVFGEIGNYGGRMAVGLVSRARGTAIDDKALSEIDLARALSELGPGPARRPRRFPIQLSNQVNPAAMTPPAFSNEVEVLRRLGPNDLGAVVDGIIDPNHECEPFAVARHTPGDHMFNRYKGHICEIDYAGMTNQLVRLVDKVSGELARGRKIIIGTADEPGYGLLGLTNCKAKVTCRERFGKDFTLYPDGDVDAYLETVAYRDKMVCDFYKAMTDAARAVNSNFLCVANIGTSLVFSGNAEDPGTDPFVMADAKALAIGQTEDWSNLQRTRQVCSYICDVYRAAYGRNGMDFRMCSVIMSRPETEAKVFSEIGHGTDAIALFNYGPHWINGDARNLAKGVFPSIRHVCETIAEAEDAIVGSDVALGDAALFYSQSCDKLQMAPGWTRDWLERNPYGKDRMCTSLMLLHCGIRTDVLSEDDLAPLLGRYKVLFAMDRNIRRDAAEALAAWMRKGGVVVKTAGALLADARDVPLPEDFFSGAGRIVEIDFSPWRDYLKPAKKAGDGCESHRIFDEDVRAKMAKAAADAGVTRRLYTDEPLVEASLLENGPKSVIALSNWTTNAQMRVSVTLEKAPAGKVRSASGAKVTSSRKSDRLEASLEIGWGDFLVVE